MPELLDHVSRISPSWATTLPLTECGRRIDDTGSTITFDEMAEKFKRQGKQRAGMSSCMTCINRVSYGQEEGDDIVSRVSAYLTRTHRVWGEIAHELEAIDALVAAHRDEYDDLVASVRTVTRIA